MHSQFADEPAIELEQTPTSSQFYYPDTSLVTPAPDSERKITRFYSHFQDCMEMYAEAERVTAYLDAHQNWFTRCAHPMKVEPISTNGYALVIGRFGALGYEVEPKIGLELLPQENGIYRIRTIAVPNYTSIGYEVDFNAVQRFVGVPATDYFQEYEIEQFQLPQRITRIEWTLDLNVGVRFPKFIEKLPQSLIQKTGDRLLVQIVRQVSRRLTRTVQQDFHTSLNLPIPKPSKSRY